MNKWIEQPLEKLTIFIKDGSHGSHKDVENGIPLLSAKDIENGKVLIPDDCRKISEIDFDQIHANYQILENDVVLTIVGTIGRTAIVEKKNQRYTFQRSVGIFRVDSNKIFPKYFYHFFTSNNFQEALERSKNASAQGGVYLGELAKIKVNYPSLPEQRQIATILSTADGVIEKTQAAIDKYKAIKQGMLQDLFTRGIDSSTGKLRPSYQDAPELYKASKLGWIPKDWEVVTIENIAKVHGRVGWKGYTVSDLRETGPLALGATHIDKENKLDLSKPVHLSMDKFIESPEIMVYFGDILIVQRGTIGKIVIIDREIGDATINPSMVILNTIKINIFFLYFQLCSFIGQRQIELLTSQTGVPMISQKQINSIKIAIPKNDYETNSIALRIQSIDKIILNEQELLLKQQQIKAGLMNDLLSGKKNVKVKLETVTHE